MSLELSAAQRRLFVALRLDQKLGLDPRGPMVVTAEDCYRIIQNLAPMGRTKTVLAFEKRVLALIDLAGAHG